jgi:hypothetical protein
VFVIDAAFLPNAVAELAVDDHFAARIVTAALSAEEDPFFFVDAALQPYVFADWVAEAVQAADFADRAFGFAAAGSLAVRNAIHTATAPPGLAAPRFARGRTLTTDNRRRSGRVDRGALVDDLDRGFRRRLLRGWFFGRRLLRRWRVALRYGLIRRWSFLDDRFLGRVGLLHRWFFILRKRLAGAAQGSATDDAAKKPFQHKAA